MVLLIAPPPARWACAVTIKGAVCGVLLLSPTLKHNVSLPSSSNYLPTYLPSSSTHTRFDCTRRGPRTTLGKYFVWSQNGSNTADPFANGFEVSARTARPTRPTTSQLLFTSERDHEGHPLPLLSSSLLFTSVHGRRHTTHVDSPVTTS